ncbi:MAG TPA: hypothetical protein PLQ36_02165 [Candidatus Gracilibacteria bacterium]|nr:hypothetical protein [Candidatus Gracilibacteria bacterium]
MEKTPETLLTWQTIDHITREHGKTWYFIFGIIILSFVCYAIFTRDVMMAVSFLLLAGIYFLIHRSGPQVLQCEFNTLGLKVNSELYPYSMMEGFYLVYEYNEFATLFLQFRKRWQTDSSFYLINVDPAEVRTILLAYEIKEIPEVREPFYRVLARIMGL